MCTGTFFLFLGGSFFPSSDDSTLSFLRESLLHAYVTGSEEVSSPYTLSHAFVSLQRWACAQA